MIKEYENLQLRYIRIDEEEIKVPGEYCPGADKKTTFQVHKIDRTDGPAVSYVSYRNYHDLREMAKDLVDNQLMNGFSLEPMGKKYSGLDNYIGLREGNLFMAGSSGSESDMSMLFLELQRAIQKRMLLEQRHSEELKKQKSQQA